MGVSTPTTLEGLSPVWLTEELRRSGTIGTDTSVTAVDRTILGEGEGFMGVIARLALSYDGPAGPASIVAKIPTPVDANRAAGRALGIYEREVRYYADVLPTLDVPQPKVYSAIYEAGKHEARLRNQAIKADRLPIWALRKIAAGQQKKSDVPPCVLLLEDLVHADVGDQVDGATPERVAAGLTAMARLHSATWGVVNIPDEHWSKGAEYIPRVLHAVHLNGRDEFVRLAGSHLSPHSLAVFDSLRATGVERTRRLRTSVPQCLTHGDFRLDNMFFYADGSVAALIDWQTAAPGPVVVDVAYFIVSSLDADTPESVVDELLAGYHAQLGAGGVSGYTLKRFLADYIEGLLVVFHRMTGLPDLVEFGDGRGPRLIEAWIRRADARLQRVPA